MAAAVAIMAIVGFVTARPKPSTDKASLPVEERVELPSTLNILVVGIDKRYLAAKQHCDAIHMVHIDTVSETIEIVNVPRGTRVEFKHPEDWEPEPELLELARAQLALEADGDKDAEQTNEEADGVFPDILSEPEDPVLARAWNIEQYVANICKYYDFETFVPHIERITGYKADYAVRVGFSEAQAFLRVLRFDPGETLQFLRHRKTYPLGDIQRSYNQAIFIKDVIVTRSDQALRFPKPARAALFRLLQTDMPFQLADALLVWVNESAMSGDAARVSNRTAPSWGTLEEIHVTESTVGEVLNERLEHLRRLQPDFAVQDLQAQIHADILRSMGQAYRAIQDGDGDQALAQLQPLQESHLWLQMTDEKARQRMTVVLAMLDGMAHLQSGSSQKETRAFAQDALELLYLEVNGEAEAAKIRLFLDKIDSLYSTGAI
ncbi:hypothetical protein A3B32_03715 [Candidatus Uhrbacteria bacterium RIFCSPLOWO2_01_FULL_53_9]|uniref:Uncharacterized protein n=1 Tax=Candidatus Uhrbacteria bacterium RIFCSPLOWO2_01_FULL_53_9 TaxID=1802403 RepID=A0A1F7UZN4_9BACT|nr:MAG: hypothetical protein A3B32_03715 [Candidatus Uhrbacteria bacterium RIFCSPLOWO2_01_FULL_53_9]